MNTVAADLTIVLPCHNEAGTVGSCVQDALQWIHRRGLTGEVIVVDNDSTDGSADAAVDAGATVVTETRRGYGHALRAGIASARGVVVIMADADATYDLSDLDAFYDPIEAGTADVVVGDRFAHEVPAAAMNHLHRTGNRLLSTLARGATGTPVHDLHCGLRSFSAAAIVDLPTWSTGMEFATHMLVHAHQHGCRIVQVPTRLRPTAPGRRSNLRPLRDGVRHLIAITRCRLSSGGRRRPRGDRPHPQETPSPSIGRL